MTEWLRTIILDTGKYSSRFPRNGNFWVMSFPRRLIRFRRCVKCASLVIVSLEAGFECTRFIFILTCKLLSTKHFTFHWKKKTEMHVLDASITRFILAGAKRRAGIGRTLVGGWSELPTCTDPMYNVRNSRGLQRSSQLIARDDDPTREIT